MPKHHFSLSVLKFIKQQSQPILATQTTLEKLCKDWGSEPQMGFATSILCNASYNAEFNGFSNFALESLTFDFQT